jgi:hypothetical protein
MLTPDEEAAAAARAGKTIYNPNACKQTATAKAQVHAQASIQLAATQSKNSKRMAAATVKSAYLSAAGFRAASLEKAFFGQLAAMCKTPRS